METIFDTVLTIARKRRALAAGDAGAGFLMRQAADELAERLATVERRFERAATLFCMTPDAQETILASGRTDSVVRIEARSLGANGDVITAEPETLPFEPESLDLAVSLYALQDMNDVPGMLLQIRRALRPDGLFLGCMAGAGTLAELREALLAAEIELTGGASPRVAPFADVRDAGGLLQRAGFALPVTDLEHVIVRYDNMFALMRDLRAMGTTSSLASRTRRPASRALFLRAAEIYAERFSDPDGRVRASFSTIWLSGWAPDESQQKPLKRGSGQVSLAKILGDRS